MLVRVKQRVLAAIAAVGVASIGALGVIAIFAGFQISGEKAFSLGRISFAKGSYIPDQRIGWRMRPRLSVYSRREGRADRLLFSTDRFGFRNPAVDLPASGKIMLLGDSFVAGHFLSEKELISERLAARVGGYVYNFGVGGYSTDQEFLVAIDALKRFQVESVVLVFFLNDLQYLTETSAFGLPKPRFSMKQGRLDFSTIEPAAGAPDNGPIFSPPEAKALAAYTDGREEYETDYPAVYLRGFRANLASVHQAIANPFSFFFDRDVRRHASFELAASKGMGAYTDASVLKPQWELAFQIFSRLQGLTAKRGARLSLFFLPELAQIQFTDFDSFAPQRYFVERCREAGLACVEPHERYLKEHRRQDLYFRDEGHLSPAGADFTARLIAESLRWTS